MNSSRMVTIATFLLLLSSSSPAFSDDAARDPEAQRRPGLTAAPREYATLASPTSLREPAHLDQENWPTWLEAVAETQATGRPTVIVVTSQKASRSTSYVEGLRADLWLARLRRDRIIEFAELSAEDAADQLSRLRINTFPTIIAYRRGTRGLEAAGRHQGIMPAPQLLGWLQGLGLVPALEDDSASGGDLTPAPNRDRAGKAPVANKDQSLKSASYDDAYPTPQTRATTPQYPQCPSPTDYAPPTKSAPPQACPPQQHAPTYQIVTLPQAAPPQGVPITINVPQQMAAPSQPTYILQQAPQQAPPLNLLTVAAAPSQPVTMAAPPQAAPTQAVIMAAPPQPAPTQTYYMAAPTQMVAAPPVQYVAAAPVQYVQAAPTQLVAAAPAAGAGLSLPGLNLPGLNLSLRPPGTVDRFIGRIGKRLHTRSYPRVAIDIESVEAAADLNERECVPAKKTPKRHADEDEEEAPPPPRRRPRAPYYDDGPSPSPQNNYPPVPSGQRP
jgi:hypothetical protein